MWISRRELRQLRVRIAVLEVQVQAHQDALKEAAAQLHKHAYFNDQVKTALGQYAEAGADSGQTLIDMVRRVAQAVGELSTVGEAEHIGHRLASDLNTISAAYGLVAEARQITYEQGTDSQDVGG